jgi:hypothetical protein
VEYHYYGRKQYSGKLAITVAIITLQPPELPFGSRFFLAFQKQAFYVSLAIFCVFREMEGKFPPLLFIVLDYPRPKFDSIKSSSSSFVPPFRAT